ncbi:polyisoprenoid-binding protein [Rhodobacteraceae bacterium RKSG542]|uniref:YceI family protein n=1 Tax=Pseudovibrio flavus TaxID=2529854 RepID=UPI0012BC84B6|nr:YceI family protein [Pseudovibrio flavus]MTI16959.1 polyisoprenoid-binding protein [Pseudovibrio flavus]
MFRKTLAAAFVASLLSTPLAAAPVEYNFDMSHSNLAFSYNHLGFSTTDGRFKDWQGTLVIDEEEPAKSSVDVTISIGSLDTFWPARDKHLLSGDFFDAANFPTATFKSTAVKKTGENELEVMGDLTIKGVSKPTTLYVNVNRIAEHPMAKKRTVGVTATTTVNRSEFGMGANVPYVSDEVVITINSEAMVK